MPPDPEPIVTVEYECDADKDPTDYNFDGRPPPGHGGRPQVGEPGWEDWQPDDPE